MACLGLDRFFEGNLRVHVAAVADQRVGEDGDHGGDSGGHDHGAVQPAIRQLEARRFITREHGVGDARHVELVPTELAVESIAAIRAFWVGRLRAVPADLLADAVAASDVLRRLAAALGG